MATTTAIGREGWMCGDGGTGCIGDGGGGCVEGWDD